MDTKKLKEIVELMKDADLKILQLTDDEGELYLEAHDKKIVETDLAAAKSTDYQGSNVGAPPHEINEFIEIRCKQVGTFYTQPDENSTETFVKEGDFVNAGDQIGLVEVMKLFNEVTVEHSGVIEKILVTNGEMVEYDQVIMLLKPEGE